MGTILCNACNIEKEATCFSGFHRRCKPCRAAMSRAKYVRRGTCLSREERRKIARWLIKDIKGNKRVPLEVLRSWNKCFQVLAKTYDYKTLHTFIKKSGFKYLWFNQRSRAVKRAKRLGLPMPRPRIAMLHNVIKRLFIIDRTPHTEYVDSTGGDAPSVVAATPEQVFDLDGKQENKEKRELETQLGEESLYIRHNSDSKYPLLYAKARAARVLFERYCAEFEVKAANRINASRAAELATFWDAAYDKYVAQLKNEYNAEQMAQFKKEYNNAALQNFPL